MKRPKKRCIFTKPLLIFAMACVLIIIDSRLRLVTTKYELFSQRLPVSFDGFKVVQLSDLHNTQFGENNSRLLAAVEKEKPDIIILTGDFIDKESDIPDQADLYKSLTKISPVYFVSGNHDWASGAISTLKETLKNAGCVYLSNEITEITVGNEKIILCGVEDPNGPSDMLSPDQVVASVRTQYPDHFVILLGHRNYWAEKYPNLDVDVIFCGHAHGGVVRLPFLGGVAGPGGELFPQWDAGVFDCGKYKLVISRGLGDNFAIPVPRFLNNPQILSVTLKKS